MNVLKRSSDGREMKRRYHWVYIMVSVAAGIGIVMSLVIDRSKAGWP